MNLHSDDIIDKGRIHQSVQCFLFTTQHSNLNCFFAPTSQSPSTSHPATCTDATQPSHESLEATHSSSHHSFHTGSTIQSEEPKLDWTKLQPLEEEENRLTIILP
eukprot:Protomagalhaensia_wolfi_Nauph_80__933@NODE_1539_length_1480_cov_297_632200_g1194_i0_p3_GENE_NODE_1539_length_1480_cov_297_632200_g1194_i0NODE_1539_length_1480_cov_297_632200_g1194_i0_p3_ORF_typecomplete_len105_score13_26_NODE_1539_length_1480_cov_297_632200_g1194_i0651965